MKKGKLVGSLIVGFLIAAILGRPVPVQAAVTPPSGQTYFSGNGTLYNWNDETESYEVVQTGVNVSATAAPATRSYTNSLGITYVYSMQQMEWIPAVASASALNDNNTAQFVRDVLTQKEGQADILSPVTTLAEDFGMSLRNLVLSVSLIILIIVLIACGVKYATASPAEAEQVKRKMIRIVIGAVIVFCAVGLIVLVASLSDKISSTLETVTH